ncbi:MAG TPA: sulfatase-like hydrolase/transferase [Tepidisphaeraceae bacterium]|jgi:arylsulfatase A-like enzyme
MKRLSFLLVLLLLISKAFAADRPPNIVMILADDLGWGDVSFNGRTEWHTPNLDQLAKEGTNYKRFYAASVVCAPSRAALMTGRYSIHNGVTGNSSLDLPSEETTIAEALKTKGYATGLFGKWHHGAPRPGATQYTHPMDQGFDEFFGYTEARAAWEKFPKKLFEGREEKPVKGYADTLFADRAIDFINRHKDQPFFCYVPFIAPHGLQEAPEDEVRSHLDKFTDSKDARSKTVATYAAQITQMDKEVGRLMKTLREAGLDENTVVVFTSDHGATFETIQKGATVVLDSNKPFRGQKRTLWEGGARVPGIVRWPGHVPAGAESHEIVHMIDLFPTFCAIAGAPIEKKWNIDGANLIDVFMGKAKGPQRTLFFEWDEDGAKQLAAMRGNLKLIFNGNNTKPEMYDVEADPAERIDRRALHEKQAREMQKELEQWYATMTIAAKAKRPTKESKPASDGRSKQDE